MNLVKAAFGIDLGGSNVRVALVNEHGKILASERAETPSKQAPEATVQTMVRLCGKLRNEAQSRGVQLVGVGIGSPGPLSRVEKKIFQTPNLPGFEDFPIGRRMEELTGLRVELDNDAKSACYGEAKFGAAKGLNNFILMTFGTGIGGGVFVDGKMVYGKTDGACEIGHMTLHPNGKLCLCGNRGCFEQYCSARAFERRASEFAKREIRAPEVFQELLKGVEWASQMLRSFTSDLAIATASLVNIFDPEAVIFGGGLFTTGGGPLCEWVQEDISSRCFRSSQKNLKIIPSSLAGNAGILGAASLVL